MTVGPSNPHGTEVTNSASGEREQPPTKQTALRNTSKTTQVLAANRVRIGCASCPLTSSPRRQREIHTILNAGLQPKRRAPLPVVWLQSGVWVARDGTYFMGGRTSINGLSDNDRPAELAGRPVALPVDRSNSVTL